MKKNIDTLFVYIGGMFIVLCGSLLNRLAILVNGRMPALFYHFTNNHYQPLTGAKLRLFADIIPFGNYVFSLGDLFQVVGIIAVVVSLAMFIKEGIENAKN